MAMEFQPSDGPSEHTRLYGGEGSIVSQDGYFYIFDETHEYRRPVSNPNGPWEVRAYAAGAGGVLNDSSESESESESMIE